MATGKELVRMMTCGIWEQFVKSRKDYCSAQIFDNRGKPISLKKAKKETFCHARILFKGCPEDSLKILAAYLKTIASTRSESMCQNTFKCYGFQEIVIS